MGTVTVRPTTQHRPQLMLSQAQRDAAVRYALAHGYKRTKPSLRWTDEERRKAIAYATQRLADLAWPK